MRKRKKKTILLEIQEEYNTFPLFKKDFILTFYLYLYQYYVSNIPTHLTTMFVRFFSSEFKWVWFISGNRYLHCDAVGEDSMLDEVGGLTVAVWGGGNCKKCLKRGWNEEKNVEKQKL